MKTTKRLRQRDVYCEECRRPLYLRGERIRDGYTLLSCPLFDAEEPIMLGVFCSKCLEDDEE